MSQPPAELFLTFEDGLHVGVFIDPARAEALNAVRRKKRGVNPVTVRYVVARAPIMLALDKEQADRVLLALADASGWFARRGEDTEAAEFKRLHDVLFDVRVATVEKGSETT